MKLSVSVPDYLWEGAQVSRCLELAELPNGKLGPAHPLTPSLLVQLGLQALVRDGWDGNAEVMQEWMDSVKDRMARGLTQTIRGRDGDAKVGRRPKAMGKRKVKAAVR